MNEIADLRKEIDLINQELLRILNERARAASKIGKEKQIHGYPIYDPIREQQILESIVKDNAGPFSDSTIIHLFKEIFKATATLQQNETQSELLVSRKMKQEDTIITINDAVIGGIDKTFIFGPCSIESEDQLEETAKLLVKQGIKFIRGGAFKARTSPYDFQGLGVDGLKIMHKITGKYGLLSVVEVMDKEQLQYALEYVDIIQIGARNMHNFSLLKEVGKVNKPVILKRGFSATIEEFKLSAEYIITQGNTNVILCERGIRTFENATRNTLDISAVPILKNETHLPVIVDVSHAAGRKDILAPLAKAALAAGCDGIMAEIHPNPKIALSDANQQMNFEEFKDFLTFIHK